MPASFEPRRPLTRREFARRRDETTKEECEKLKGSPEYKKWAAQRHGHQATLPLLLAAALAAVIMGTCLGSGMMRPSAPPSVQVPSPSGIVADLTAPCPGTVIAFTSSEDASQVPELTRRLGTAAAELGAATRANAEILRSLTHCRASHTECPPVAEPAACPEPPFVQQQQQQQACPEPPAAVLSSIPHPEIIIGGLSVALFVTLAGSSIACRRAVHRAAAATAAATAAAEALSAELRELAFEKDTAEQSVSILEQELQRKVTQLAEAQSAKAAAAAAAHSTPPRSDSPRIAAVMAPGASPVALARTPGGGTPGPETLPPPPRQLVERFLAERGAIAIETEQVQVWLEMEGAFAALETEAARLRAAVEVGNEAAAGEVAALAAALEEQREAARAAKAALKAVRAAGNPGRTPGSA